MADYPSSIWTPPTRGTNMSDPVTQTDILDEQNDEIVAMQTELGTAPSGSYSTVSAALLAALRNADNMEHIDFTPAGNTDIAAGPANWVTLGNITVPTWCTEIEVILHVTGAHSVTATSTYIFRARVGSTGPLSDYSHIGWTATGDRRNASLSGSVASPGTGTQALVVNAERRTGTGSMRVDTESRLSATVFYRA